MNFAHMYVCRSRTLTEGASGTDKIACTKYYDELQEAATLPLKVYDECFRGTNREIGVLTVNLDDPLKYYRMMSSNDAATDVYMQAKDSSPLIVAQNSKGKPELGSGFYIRDDGLLATNYHVIARHPDHILVIDGALGPRTARVVAEDPANQIALLRVDRRPEDPPVVPLKLGSSDSLHSDQRLEIVGHTLGQPVNFVADGKFNGFTEQKDIHNLSFGPNSPQAKANPDRSMIEYEGVIAEGNSGSALFKIQGSEVVGMNDFSNQTNKAWAIRAEKITLLEKTVPR